MMTKRLQQLFRFLEQAPEDSFTRYSIAYEYLQQGDLQNALKYFQELRTADPGYVGLYYHLGKTHERLEDFEAALEAYDAGLAVAQERKDRHAYEELQRARRQAQDEWEDW